MKCNILPEILTFQNATLSLGFEHIRMQLFAAKNCTKKQCKWKTFALQFVPTLDRVLWSNLSSLFINNIGMLKTVTLCMLSWPGHCTAIQLRFTNCTALLVHKKLPKTNHTASPNYPSFQRSKVLTRNRKISQFPPRTYLISNLYNFLYFYILIIRIIYCPENLKD